MKRHKRDQGWFPAGSVPAGMTRIVRLMLFGTGLVMFSGVFLGCAQLIEKAHVSGTDNDAFFPFVRASVILSQDAQKEASASATETQSRHSGPVLRQGNVALDLDLSRVEGKDTTQAVPRTFSVDVYSVALRGSTRPERLWGFYLEGLAGFQRVDMTTSGSFLSATSEEAGVLLGFGLGYAFTDNATVHARGSASRVTSGALAMQEVLATYWFTPHVGLSGGYRSWQYFNELIILGFDFRWRGPAAGLVVAF